MKVAYQTKQMQTPLPYKKDPPKFEDIPILTYGSNSNLLEFRKLLSIKAQLDFGELGKVVETLVYPTFAPVAYNPSDLSPAADPHGLIKKAVEQRVINLEKDIHENNKNKVKLYALTWGKMSVESRDIVKLHSDYTTFSSSKDPLRLLRAIIETHRFTRTTTVAAISKRDGREQYIATTMGFYESLPSFKERFDSAYEVYIESGNTSIPSEDRAIDFVMKLSKDKYGEFQSWLENSLTSKTINNITIESVYKLASEFKPLNVTQPTRVKAVFNVKGNNVTNKNEGLNNVKCWGCGKIGHTLRACPNKKTRVVNVTTRHMGNTNKIANQLGTNHVILDNGANVSIFRPEHLKNIRALAAPQVSTAFQGSQLICHACGDLPGFFCVDMSTTIQQNILSFSQVESMYPIYYECGRFIVESPYGDIVFKRNALDLYVSDIQTWPAIPKYRPEEKYLLMTASTRPPKKLKLAHELLKNAGYPSPGMVQDYFFGNYVSGIPIDRNDLDQAIDVFGQHVGYVRGRSKWKDATAKLEVIQPAMKEDQTLFSDVADFEGEKYLITVSKPMDLCLASHLPDQHKERIGSAIQGHITKLSSYGYRVRVIHGDNEFRPQELVFPGIRWEICGAGDHVGIVENKIQQLKATTRSVIHGLAYPMPRFLIKNLIDYVVYRQNTFPTGPNKTAPRVLLTGHKIRYKQELSIGFGDYVEVLTPPKVKRSSVLVPRSEPAIALCPCGNVRGSWIFLNLKTGKLIRRSIWRRMPMTELVVKRMDELNNGSIIIEEIHDDEYDADNENETDDQNDDNLKNAYPDPVHIEETHTVEEDPGLDNEPMDAGPEMNNSIELNNSSDNIELYGSVNLTVRQAREKSLNVDEAIATELRSMIAKNVFTPIKRGDIPRGAKVIPSHIIIKEKFLPDGSFSKLKARLVAGGHMQDNSSIYTDSTYAPTPKFHHILSIIARLVGDGYQMETADFESAYLNATIDGDIYMLLDINVTKILLQLYSILSTCNYIPYLDNKDRLIVKLDKAIYGLQQSAKLWNGTATKSLTTIGYKQSTIDECIFYNEKGVIILYVDDLLMLHKNQDMNDKVILTLSESFNITKTSKGDGNYFYLGMNIVIGNKTVKFSMKQFVDSVIKEYGSTKQFSSPATTTLFDHTESVPKTACNDEDRKKFHSTTAKLLYLCNRIRPDLSLAISYLTTRVTCANNEDLVKLSRVIGYLMKTREYELIFNIELTSRLEVFIDASFSIHQDGKSQSGMIIKFCGATVYWKSNKQGMVSKSSTESELIALSDFCTIVIEFNHFLSELGLTTDIPIIYQDNESVLKLMKSQNFSHRTRHLKARSAFL